MNKSDVIDRVADAAGVARRQAENVLDAFFDTVRSATKGGDRVAWPGFGSFSATQRKARTGRNPRTGESVKVPASKAVKFSASSTLKDFLNTGSGTKKAAGGKKASAKKAAPAKKAPARKVGATGGSTKKSAPVKKAIKATKATKATAAKK